MMAPKDIRDEVRESLGLPPPPPAMVPMEGHVCDFPLWSYSKKRTTVTELRIDYNDGSYFTLRAPEGMPSPSFPGYLDCLLFSGQRSLHTQEYVQMSVYEIFKTLKIDPKSGKNYENFRHDMHKAFVMYIKTNRFRDPTTGKRGYIDYFHVLYRMRMAPTRRETSMFHFDALFLASLRAGYVKRVDFEFCLHLDRRNQPLARFLYAHILKRLGQNSMYIRQFPGFLHDVGLGHMAELPIKARNQKAKLVLFPALGLIEGHAFTKWEMDDRENIFFVH
jgi:hypothetical protein